MTQRIGILGLGSIGARHARNFVSEGADVIGFDPDPARVDMIAAVGVGAADSKEALIAQSDGVVIATPSQFHLDDLTSVIDSGRHALVEKPLAHRADSLKAVLARADEKNVHVFAALNLRFHPVVKAVRAVLKAGTIGDILWARFLAASFLPDWRPHQDHRTGYANNPRTGGALFDFIHEFDLAVHLLGPAETVAAAARNTGSIGLDSEDCADTILRHTGGVHSTIHVDYVSLPRQRFGEIAGTAGVVRMDLEVGHLLVRNRAGETVEDKTFHFDPNDMYKAEAAAFLACMMGAEQPACSGWEAYDVLNVVLDARDKGGLPVP